MRLGLISILMICGGVGPLTAQPAAKELYSAMIRSSNYRATVRPIRTRVEPVLLYMNLSMIQILEVDEKRQIVMMNMWVNQEWYDPTFLWNPSNYGGIDRMHLPATMVWTPDIVLYNNAGGDWDLASSSNTKISVRHDGTMVWKPPIIFHSQCEIDVEFFPFDTQTCILKLGTWTHDGCVIDLRHMAQKYTDISVHNTTRGDIKWDQCETLINYAIDLDQFVSNTEWDLLAVPARRNIKKYPCCTEPYLDITFEITIRRRTLFYAINLICPCLAISFLTMIVFYLPAESAGKVTLSISILVSVTVFFLLLFDISPPTSLVVPLILKYLLFTMILVTMSVMSTVLILNVHWRSQDAHAMSPWVRQIFTRSLPRLLYLQKREEKVPQSHYAGAHTLCEGIPAPAGPARVTRPYGRASLSPEKYQSQPRRGFGLKSSVHPDNPSSGRRNAVNRDIDAIEVALQSIQHIVDHMQKEDEILTVRDDWKYVAVVLDRLFLWLFGIATIVGVMGIFLQAPSLTDHQSPMSEPYPTVNVTKLCKLPHVAGKISCSHDEF